MQKPAVTTNWKTAPTIVERLMAAHSITRAIENMACTVVQSDSDATGDRPQPPSNSVIKPPLDMRRELKRALAHLSIMTKTDVEAIVQNRLTKCTNNLESLIFKSVDSTFEDALQASYFNSNNDPKFAMFNVC